MVDEENLIRKFDKNYNQLEKSSVESVPKPEAQIYDIGEPLVERRAKISALSPNRKYIPKIYRFNKNGKIVD